ncbi:carboxymuconolactone decarboxylase family protein [Actinacidiphila glaucinigra]|uniref:carboxymuconolactone decarboxylase family protein n=1 Tax=Actinacidiphila glaucinigra TaxID=235986 RepID=UPI002E3074E2|nr:carboxymuconolactone decarboxylase family protein [Actinacidiphila glaucinigra]
MSDTIYTNQRFDPDLTSFHSLAGEMAKAFGYKAELTIDGQLAQLIRLRVAQLTPCSYCLILHTRTAFEKGINPDKVAHLASWRQSGMFHASERAALAYCEGLTDYDLNTFPALHEELTNHFNETEIAELAAVIINMNVWTRLKLAQGATPHAVTEDANPESS